jgi:hypothetical protein
VKPDAPTDDDRRFWLERFTDDEVVEMAEAMYGGGSVEAVRDWRARLFRPRNAKGGPSRLARIRRDLSVTAIVRL